MMTCKNNLFLRVTQETLKRKYFLWSLVLFWSVLWGITRGCRAFSVGNAHFLLFFGCWGSVGQKCWLGQPFFRVICRSIGAFVMLIYYRSRGLYNIGVFAPLDVGVGLIYYIGVAENPYLSSKRKASRQKILCFRNKDLSLQSHLGQTGFDSGSKW